jgi:phage tail-like protein
MAQTPFLLLNAATGWQLSSHDAGVTVGDRVQLQTLPGSARPLNDPSGDLGGLALPAAMAVDCGGTLYVLDGDTICHFDPCDGRFVTLHGIGGSGSAPRRFSQPRGMTISCRDHLYVADSGNRRVQVFAVAGWALRMILEPLLVEHGADGIAVKPTRALAASNCPPNSTPKFPAGTWLPSAVAVAAKGRIYVADKANGLIHQFDAHGCWLAAWDGASAESAALLAPVQLALDKNGYLYVVQEDVETISVLDGAGQFVRHVRLPSEAAKQFHSGGIGFDSAGRLLLTDAKTGCLYIYDATAENACRCHGVGQASCLTVDSAGQPIVFDKIKGIVHALRSDSAYMLQGTVTVGPLDSELYRCVWHRLRLSGSLASGTFMRVESYSADISKLPAQIDNLPATRWGTQQIASVVGACEWDCLIDSQPGRYLWLRLSLYGDGAQTPTIAALRVEYPRNSALQYLPAVYQQDADSAEFLSRFLSITDRFFEQFDTAIGDMAYLFDAWGSSAEFLPWLASWIGLTFDVQWSEAARRRVLAAAHLLYEKRGTAAGLTLFVELVVGYAPQLLEHFKLRRWLFLNSGRLGEQGRLWGADVVDRLQLDSHAEIGNFQLIDSGDPLLDPLAVDAHRFTLFVPLPRCDEQHMRMIERIVAVAKPAHVQGDIAFVRPGMCMGSRLLVGVNTVIGDYPSGVTVQTTQLGQGSMLSAPAAQVGSRIGQQRIGVNSQLE